MSASSEPLDLQLQRERVARSQVEAALQSTRLQLIEMEYALRQARADASRQLAEPPLAPPPPTPLPEPAAKPAAIRTRARRSPAKLAESSLGEVARAAGAIERASRLSPDPGMMAAPMAGMVPGRAAQPLLSTLDLHEGDNRAIVSDFVEHLQTRLSKMQACYGSGNLTELKWHVSWITTNASRVGFEPLMAPATNLKNVLEQQQNDRIPALLDEVIQLCERATVDSARR